jgi:hypothetical protein
LSESNFKHSRPLNAALAKEFSDLASREEKTDGKRLTI